MHPWRLDRCRCSKSLIKGWLWLAPRQIRAIKKRRERKKSGYRRRRFLMFFLSVLYVPRIPLVRSSTERNCSGSVKTGRRTNHLELAPATKTFYHLRWPVSKFLHASRRTRWERFPPSKIPRDFPLLTLFFSKQKKKILENVCNDCSIINSWREKYR